MNGFDILKARKRHKVDQRTLQRALGLVQRGTLTDIESGAVEVTDAWARKAISAVEQIAADRSKRAA